MSVRNSAARTLRVGSIASRAHLAVRRGFTLIELMIVVVIMGVLASLAIYSVTSYIQHAKTGEAREIIGSIMAGQEAYFDETSRYLDATGGVASANFYPADAAFNGKQKIMWGATDACVGAGGVACVDHFRTLGVSVGSPVMFRYATTTFDATDPPPTGTWAAGYNPGNVASPVDGYVVIAVSDLTGNGTGFSVLVGSSMQADIYGENLGE